MVAFATPGYLYHPVIPLKYNLGKLKRQRAEWQHVNKMYKNYISITILPATINII